MNCLDANKRWYATDGSGEGFYTDLPFDALIYRDKDLTLKNGGNGYYRSEKLTLEKRMEFPRCHKAWLEIEGACAIADVFVDGVLLATVTHPCTYSLDVSAYCGGTHTITLNLLSGESAGYTGLGVSGGIKLKTVDSPLYIANGGICVITENDDDRAELSVSAEVINDTDKTQAFVLSAQVYNMKDKRVAKKARKIKLAAFSRKTFVIPLKMIRHYNWSISDAYLYAMEVSLSQNDVALDAQRVRFGIRKAALDEQKGFTVSGKSVRLKGAVISRDNGIIGNRSIAAAETRKAAVLKESGFNAVRCVTAPTECALDALDRAGLMCVVDIFSVLKQPKITADSHLFFDGDYRRIVDSTVRSLRNHPCVIAYGVCDCPAESYNRGGLDIVREIVSLIKECDASRPVYAAATEILPTAQEMIDSGVRPDKVRAAEMTGGLLSLSREKNTFRDLTKDYFDLADIAGYSFLHQRYQSDKMAFPSRRILGTASLPDRAFDALDEAEKNGVLGDFVSCGIDSLGGSESGDLIGKRCTDSADIDLTLQRKPMSYYREICMGVKNKSYIVTLDPEHEEDRSDARHSWYWPRFLGKPVTVLVYTSGDVVALYLDSKLVGRKLAGKINKHVATFKINYYPGKLEAVSFHRGVEITRAQLETASSPKALKINCACKNVSLSGDNTAFVEILVTDKEGRLCDRAQREVEVSVTGDGELYALSSADPYLTAPASVKTLPVYEGRALAAVRGLQEGKMTVKVTGEGLLSYKITVKVKP